MRDYDPYDYIDEPDAVYCTECGSLCKPVEETFSYAGTHCTHGQSGIHHTGHYVSECCGADVSDEPQYDGNFADND